VADTINIGFEERLDRLRKKLRGLENKAAKVEDYVRQRTMTYRLGRWQKPLFGPSVTFDNDASGAHTVIEVSAGDRPGLLYDLALAISRLGLDVRTAKVSTLADRAHDVFYVREANGAKVEDGARRTAIQKELVTQAQRSPAEPR
jgi:[protein-PII] uridylyltransferase